MLWSGRIYHSHAGIVVLMFITNQDHYTYQKTKKKDHIISINSEKAFHKTQHLSRKKTNLSKVRTEKNSLNLIKSSKKNLESTPKLNDEWQYFSLNIMQKQVTNLIISVQHFTVAKSRKRYKRHPDQKGEGKILFIQRQYACLHKRKSSEIYKMLIEIIRVSSMFIGYTINILKSILFLHTNV